MSNVGRSRQAGPHPDGRLLDSVINDAYGHHVGDDVLVTVGKRLTAVLRPGDTLSRLAGDEFVVLCEDLTSPAQIHEIAGRVLRSLAVPFTFERSTIDLSGSVGPQALLITLSHALGLTVVAEGVETHRQLDRLRLLGCDHIHGHLVSPAVPARRIPELLASRLAR